MGGETILIIIGVVTLVMGVASIAGGQYRISRYGTAIKVTQEIATAWEDKARLQATQINELKAANAEMKTRVDVLQDLVTNKSAIDAVLEGQQMLVHKVEETLALAAEIRGHQKRPRPEVTP